MDNFDYQQKYLKYKKKYLNLKNQIAGAYVCKPGSAKSNKLGRSKEITSERLHKYFIECDEKVELEKLKTLAEVNNIDLKTLKTKGFTAVQLQKAGYNLKALIEAGYTLEDLKEARYPFNDLERVFLFDESWEEKLKKTNRGNVYWPIEELNKFFDNDFKFEKDHLEKINDIFKYYLNSSCLKLRNLGSPSYVDTYSSKKQADKTRVKKLDNIYKLSKILNNIKNRKPDIFENLENYPILEGILNVNLSNIDDRIKNTSNYEDLTPPICKENF